MSLVTPVLDEGRGNTSWLVDLGDGRYAVIDPGRHPGPYLAVAERQGGRVAFGVETHLHADFVSGSRELAAFGAASLVLCSVADVPAALAEIRRVLRPGGELRFLERVRADTAGLARAQRVLDATVWPFFGGGCHTHRDTRAAIEAAGFAVDRLERLRLPDTRIPSPASPHILGVATNPEDDRP